MSESAAGNPDMKAHRQSRHQQRSRNPGLQLTIPRGGFTDDSETDSHMRPSKLLPAMGLFEVQRRVRHVLVDTTGASSWRGGLSACDSDGTSSTWVDED